MVKVTAKRVQGGLLVLVLLVGGGNLWATHDQVAASAAQQKQNQDRQAALARQEQAAQRKAGLLIEAAICTDMGTMAKIPPPAGAASSNPSRAYEQDEHRAWAGLYSGLGCKRIGA
jgi:hypothetical protein